MLPEWTVVGFSGHRSLADPAGTATRIGAMLDELMATRGPLVATSSLAKGADAIFVKAAAARGIPILLALPFPPERFQRDFEPDEIGWLRRNVEGLDPFTARQRRLHDKCADRAHSAPTDGFFPGYVDGNLGSSIANR